MSERVLVVDDSMVTRVVVRRYLAGEDVEVLEATDGQDAVDRMAELDPDVVLCDVEMPRLDGFGVLGWMREHPRFATVPVVFLTAVTSPEEVARALDEGAHDYLRKPFEPVELVARVRAARRIRRLQGELLRRNAELEDLVSTDVLTGLRNRRHLVQELGREISRARRRGTPAAVLLVDVDRFKAINDRYGHAGGDRVLQQVALRMHGVSRAEDVLGRWGGEEFLLLAGDTDAEGAAALAERLRRAVADEALPVEGTRNTRVTVSVGWSSVRDGDDPDAVLARADEALYAAKAAGRNVVRSA